MRFSYYIKSQNRLVLSSMLLITVIFVASNITFQDYMTWKMMKLFAVLFLAFLVAGSMADEYEHKREGLVFVTDTPVYKQVLIKYAYGWAVVQFLMAILFISAYAGGLEPDFVQLPVMMLYSTCLSLIGMTVSNITRKTLPGYGAALIVWVIEIFLGSQANETMIWPVSVVVNLDLSRHILWGNLLSIGIITALLFLLNLAILGRGEGVWHKTIPASLLILLFVLGGAGLLHYRANDRAQALSAERIQLGGKSMYVTGSGDAKLLYINLPNQDVEHLLRVWEAVHAVIGTELLERERIDILKMDDGGRRISSKLVETEPKMLQMSYASLKNLEPPVYGGKDWAEGIAVAYLENTLLQNIKDEHTRHVWSQYLFITKDAPRIETKLTPAYLQAYNDDSYQEKKSYFTDEIASFAQDEGMLRQFPDYALFYMLQLVDRQNGMEALLKEVDGAGEAVSVEGLKKLLTQYIKDTEVKRLFGIYQPKGATP